MSGAVCPIPDSDACTGMSPCSDCVSLSKWEPLEPYEIEDEAPGSPIFQQGAA